MYRSLFLATFIFVFTSVGHANPTAFGAAINAKSPTLTVDEAIAQFDKTKNTTVLLDAEIDKVCEKKGCWMTIKSKTRDVRVVFKDYGFFVPVALMGKSVLVEGQMTEKKLTLAETKHYVSDAGGDPSKVTEPATDYQFVASGVVVKQN